MLIILLHGTAQAQGAYNAAMGVQGAASKNVFSNVLNPANVALLDSATLGMDLHQLSLSGRARNVSLQIAAPLKKIATQIGFANFGNSYYNLSQVNFAIAKKLSPTQGIGIGVNYYREFIYLQSNSTGVSAAAGYYNQLSSRIRFGAFVVPIIFVSDERLQRAFSSFNAKGGLGLFYNATPSLDLNGEVLVDEKNDLRLGAGFCYHLKSLDLMMGLSNQQGLINAGLGIPLNRFNFNLTYGFRESLGSGVQTSLIYQW